MRLLLLLRLRWLPRVVGRTLPATRLPLSLLARLRATRLALALAWVVWLGRHRWFGLWGI